MSGSSLAAHPRLAGAGRHRFGANQGCLRARLVRLLLRARLWGFRLLCFMPGCCPTVLRSHVLLAHAPRRGRSCVRAGGAAPVVGVFARWVAGVLVFALLPVFDWGVCVFWVLPPPFFCPALLACVLTSLVWALGCARLVCRAGGVMGWGDHVPPLMRCWWCCLPSRCVARKGGGWGCSRGVLTRARRGGAGRGCDGAGRDCPAPYVLLGGGGGVFARLARTSPPPGSRGVCAAWRVRCLAALRLGWLPARGGVRLVRVVVGWVVTRVGGDRAPKAEA